MAAKKPTKQRAPNAPRKHVTPTPIDRIDALIERMCASGVADRAELRGCSADEIAVLETRFGVALPAAYRRYLERMGHAAGRLFTHDHVETSYGQVMRRNSEKRDTRVPPDGLVILSRLGEQFLFIRCDASDESAVWYFASWDDQPAVQSHPSIATWLECWCDEAEGAIAAGYYRRSR